MARLKNLQQALDESVGKAPPPEKPQPVKAASAPAPASKHITAASREGKEFTGAWLHPDYGMGLRMVQLRKRRDAGRWPMRFSAAPSSGRTSCRITTNTS